MATAVAKSKDNFLSALGDKLNDAETADFTIICGSEEIKVHKFVLRLHSVYFDRLFKSQFQEATQSRIELNDDPKAAVSNLVAYLYYFDYSITPGDLRLEKFDAPAEGDSGYEPTNYFPSRMYGHACMYTLAEKYDIPNLKKLAKKKFEECSQDRLNFAIHHLMYLSRFVDDFMDVIPYVYANTAPNELGLRTSIVELWGWAPRMFTARVLGKHWLELVKRFPELGVDMISGLMAVFEPGGCGRIDPDPWDGPKDEHEEVEDAGEEKRAAEALSST